MIAKKKARERLLAHGETKEGTKQVVPPLRGNYVRFIFVMLLI